MYTYPTKLHFLLHVKQKLLSSHCSENINEKNLYLHGSDKHFNVHHRIHQQILKDLTKTCYNFFSINVKRICVLFKRIF